MASLTAPQAPPVWNHKPEDIAKLTSDAIDKVKKIHDEVAALSADKCNFNSVSRSRRPTGLKLILIS